MIHTDTIAAIATAMGNSGIGIVRISGQEAVAVADRIFKEKGKQETLEGSPSHTIHYGYIYDGDQVVDEVLVMLMRGPRSFTAEDTVEIDCHGGMLVTRRILETVLKAGARLAEPGEFTKRAFLNGRIDLSQAEAVIDVINAKNEYALKSSVGQLRGSVSKKIRELREKILYEIAFIESALDDPEHISLDGYGERLLIGVQKMEQELSRLIRSSANGRVVSEGDPDRDPGKAQRGKIFSDERFSRRGPGHCDGYSRDNPGYPGGTYLSPGDQPQRGGHGRDPFHQRRGGKNWRGAGHGGSQGRGPYYLCGGRIQGTG